MELITWILVVCVVAGVLLTFWLDRRNPRRKRIN